MENRNEDIRQAAKRRQVKMWWIAERLGINETTFYRKLRQPLDAETKSKILKLIDELSESHD